MARDLLEYEHPDAAENSRPLRRIAIIVEPDRHIMFDRTHAEPRRNRPCAARSSAWSRSRRRRGLTLVELVLVIAILVVLASLAVTIYQGYRDRLKINQAVGDVMVIALSVTEFNNDYKRLPADLGEVGKDAMRDPWGNPYQYINHATASPGHFRKDKNIVPINSDFDLYSKGKDGDSVAPLTAQKSRDDIIRANDGAFIGLASAYDP